MIQHGVYFQPIGFSFNDGDRNWEDVLISHGSQLEPVNRTELRETTEAWETILETKTKKRKNQPRLSTDMTVMKYSCRFCKHK